MSKRIEMTQETIDRISELKKSGMGTRKIAEETGYKRDVVKRVIRENGIKEEIEDKYAFLTKELLEELYIKEHKSLDAICLELGCSKFPVVQRMNKYGIKRRGYKDRCVNISKEELERLYIQEDKTQEEIAKIYNCAVMVISRNLKKYGIKKKRKTLIIIPSELLVSMYSEKHLSIASISEIFKCSPSTIRSRLQELGIIKYNTIFNMNEQELKALCNDGRNVKELASKFHCSNRTIRRVLDVNNVKTLPTSLAKVTYDELYEKLIVQRRNRSDVARDYGVSSATLGLKLRELNINIIKERNKRKGVTKEDLEEMYYNQGLTQEQIAEKLGTNRTSVVALFKKQGIERKKTKYEDILTYDLLKDYYVNKNMPPVAIAKELEVPANPIRKKVIEWGLKDLKTGEEQKLCKAKAYNISLNHKRSKGEAELASLYPFDITNDSTIIGLELDMYCSDKKLAVEYNGDYWHSTKFHRNSGLHLAKLSICENRGIRLISVFERDWLGRTRKKIEAHLDRIMYPERTRKVEGDVKAVYKYLQEPFERKNNFFNYRGSQYCIGTFKNKKLINTLSYNIRNNKITVVNYTTEAGYEEDFNKLVAYLKEEIKLPIVLNIDKRYYNNEFPESMGFKHLEDKEPELYYVLNTKALRKEEASEEYLNNPKCFEVYDCGSSVWILD